MIYPYRKWINKDNPNIIAIQAYEFIDRVTIWKNNTYIKTYKLESFPKNEYES